MLQKKTSKALDRMLKELFDHFDDQCFNDDEGKFEEDWLSFSGSYDITDYLSELGFEREDFWSSDFEGVLANSLPADPLKLLKWARKMVENKSDLVLIESEDENLIFEGTISEAKKKLQPALEFFERRKKLQAFK